MIYNPYGKKYIWSFLVYYIIIIIWCTRFETNYNSCTGKSNENICSSSGGAQEKGRTRWNSVYHQNWWFSVSPPLNANVFFSRFFLISPCVWWNAGFWRCVCLTLRITLMCEWHLKYEWVAPFSYPSIEKHSPSTLDQYLTYIKIMNLWRSSTKLLIPRERKS